MFNRSEAPGGKRLLLTVLAVCLATGTGEAATIGQWVSNTANQVWASSGNFSTIYAKATASPQNHTIENPEAITGANLSNNNYFIISNPTVALTGNELTTLVSWVHAGGILLLFADPDPSAGGGSSTVSIANNILTTLGNGSSATTMQVASTTFGSLTQGFSSGTFASNDPASSGLTGGMGFFQGYNLSGGNALMANTSSNPFYQVANGLRVDSFQLGKVYVFGEEFASNGAGTLNSNNARFFIQLLAQQGLSGPGPGSLDSPEPATFALSGLALAGLLAWRMKRGRS
jgi:hypothetical protein